MDTRDEQDRSDSMGALPPEDELRQLFWEAFQSAPVGMLVSDPAGRIVLANEVAAALFGYSLQDFVGLPVEVLLPPDARVHHVEARTSFRSDSDKRVMAGRALRGLHRSGREIMVEVGLSHLIRSDGVFAFAAISDVTERNRTDERLRAHERQLQAVLEAVNDIVFEFDADGRYLNVWAADESKLAAPKSELLGRRVADVLGDVASQRFVEAFRRVLGSGAAETLEYTLTLADGEHFFVAQIRRLPGPPGAADTVCMGISDVTGQKRAEEAVRAGERRVLLLFETLDLVVLQLDVEGRVVYVNSYFLDLAGYRLDEILGERWIDRFLPEGDRPAMHGVFRELLEHELHRHHENAVVTKAGEERLIAWNNTALRDPRGRPIGTLSVGADITDQHRLEEQFLQAQKMEAIGRLAGGVAHDFNNLLTVIIAHSQFLMASLPPGDPAHEDADEIRRAADRATALTRQLLAFSRRQVLAPRLVKLDQVVANLEKMLQRLIGEDIALETRLLPTIPPVLADPGQIEQVIMNLVVNARDAMPDGGTLTIETGSIELDEASAHRHGARQPGPHVLLTVTDTGIGMDESTRALVFEPFFTTKPPEKGTGLGLSTVYGIVKQSGGGISVSSEPGRGAAFRIYLPAAEQTVAAAAPARADTAHAAPRGSHTILLAEDDRAVRGTAERILKRAGYEVLVAGDGEEALAVSAQHRGPIHLLVSDIVMPRMGGPELAKRLRAARPDVRVLHLSGYADLEVSQKGLMDERSAFLEKPFTVESLTSKVREVLEAEREGG